MTNKSKITNQVIDHIEEHLDDEMNLDTIAEALAYSKFYLNHVFTEVTGSSIYQYIQKRRITKAANELVTSDHTISQIAMNAGYGSQQAFTLAFRQVYFCTPGEYRSHGTFYPAQMRLLEIPDFSLNKVGKNCRYMAA